MSSLEDIYNESASNQEQLEKLFNAAAKKGNELPFFTMTNASNRDKMVLHYEDNRASFITRSETPLGYFYMRETYHEHADLKDLMQMYADESVEHVDIVGKCINEVPDEQGFMVQLLPPQMSRILKRHFALEKTIEVIERETGIIINDEVRSYAKGELADARKQDPSKTDMIDAYIEIKNGFDETPDETPASAVMAKRLDGTIGHDAAVRLALLPHMKN